MAGNVFLLCGGALLFEWVMRRGQEGAGEELGKDKTFKESPLRQKCVFISICQVSLQECY